MSKKLIIIVSITIILVLLGSVIIKSTSKKSVSPAPAQQAEDVSLLEKLGDLVILPEGETPTIATVSDAGKVKNQVFFQRAENGDKVIVYQQAKKAILYRPSINKIVEVTSISITTPPVQPATPSATVTY